MNDGELLEMLSTEHPVGLGGCQNGGNPFEACEYNVTVFDDSKRDDKVIFERGAAVKISYGSLGDSDSDTLINYDGMKVLQDPSWELQMLLSKIREKRTAIFRDYARNCLVNSIFCMTRAKDGLDSDIFASCWAKSSLVYLANSLLALNSERPAPSHCLNKLRNLAKNSVSDKASVINDCIGIERATPSLLDRMCKSTIGFSDEIEHNNHSRIIQEKTQYFIKNSMLADCYMYLTCVNHGNFISMKNSIHRNPDLIYILKVALDLENDREKLRQDLETIRKTSDSILQHL